MSIITEQTTEQLIAELYKAPGKAEESPKEKASEKNKAEKSEKPAASTSESRAPLEAPSPKKGA